MVLFNPKLLTSIYIGINPPETNIVITIIFVKNPFKGKLSRDSTYPAGIVTNKFTVVPTAVYIIVFRYPRHIPLFWIIVLYPSKVTPLGKSHIAPELTALGSLKDALII